MIQNNDWEMKRYLTEDNLERLKKLRPIDDDFMRALFHDNRELVQLVLRIILDMDDLIVTQINTQADMKRVTGARSVCLDAYATDSTGKKYDIEIQRSSEGAGPHRARYHSSIMDVENLCVGQRFDELPDTFTIFITENDYFGKDRPVYVFRRYDTETQEYLSDGTTIIYVNGAYSGSDMIGKLMHDFRTSDPDDMHIELLADTARYFKVTEEGVSSMCKSMEELRDKSFAEGKAEGLAEGKFNTYADLINKGLISISDAANSAGLTEDEFTARLNEAGYTLS